MLKHFKENPKIGTVGCRLHYGNNTIQHNGIVANFDSVGNFGVGHIDLNKYYSKTYKVNDVIGSTGGLLMIKKIIFEKLGYFNENYISCFEDVELNLKSTLLCYRNICDTSLVAYHFESQTRNDDPENLKKLQLDFKNTLFPFVSNNIERLHKHILMIKT
jgi:GT2 family glycosyltransferase